MKELFERHQYTDYMAGKQMPARDFTNGALDIFGEYVYPEVLREHCGGQIDFQGEIWYTKCRPKPIVSPEQQHLGELRPIKSGITKML